MQLPMQIHRAVQLGDWLYVAPAHLDPHMGIIRLSEVPAPCMQNPAEKLKDNPGELPIVAVLENSDMDEAGNAVNNAGADEVSSAY